jgi:hypothetical protein
MSPLDHEGQFQQRYCKTCKLEAGRKKKRRAHIKGAQAARGRKKKRLVRRAASLR